MTSQMLRAARMAGVVVLVVGGTVLAGWALDIESLKTVYGPITMKTNAALAFVLSGAALWCAAAQRFGRFGLAAAIAAAAIGGLTLSEHVAGWNLGIDELLFRELPGAAATTSPNRMGPHAATSFMFGGLALALLYHRHPAAIRIAQALSFTGLAFALVAVTGYVYGASQLFDIAQLTGIALHTALALVLLHGGILAASAPHGAMETLADDGIAGPLLRRLSVAVVGLPLLLGYLLILAREEEMVDRGLGVSLFTVSVIVLLMVMLWRTAGTIRTTDAARRRALEQAEQANLLKDQFIAVLSHELRTPLNVMLGRLRTLEGDADDETRLRAAGIIARNGRLLARLVEDLLDHSRASSGQFDITRAPVDLNAVVRNAVDAVSGEAAARGVAMVMDLDAGVGLLSVDQQRLQQVIGNVLINAVKFTPRDGRIDVRTARRGDGVVITVTDTGVGFAPDFAPFLFEPFRQADASTRREHGGLGLGLSIARHLIALHGGTITASSRGIGHGATFELALPASAMLDAAPALAGGGAPGAEAVRA